VTCREKVSRLSVERFLNRREATLEVLVDLRQVVCHALLLLSTVSISNATSSEASRGCGGFSSLEFRLSKLSGESRLADSYR
jgi:hypothetical protein